MSKSPEAPRPEKIAPRIENFPSLQSERLIGTKVKDNPLNTASKKVRVPDLVPMKERGERIVMLTAYDATMARLLDRDHAGLSASKSASNAGLDEFFPTRW